MGEKMLIGRKFLKIHGAVIDFKSNSITINTVNENGKKNKWTPWTHINSFILKWKILFMAMTIPWLGSSAMTPLKITLKDINQKPVACRATRYSTEKRKLVKKFVDELLAKGIIRRAINPLYISLVVMVKNNDGSDRLCVWFKHINKMVERNNFPIPVPLEQVYDMRDRAVFTKIDLRWGYYQRPICEEHKKYFAFATQDGTYEFNFSPMGYTNSSQEFQQEIAAILKDHTQYIKVFQDDICIYSKNKEEHRIHVESVLNTMLKARIILNFDKCHGFKSEVKYCGMIVGNNEVYSDPAKWKSSRSQKNQCCYVKCIPFYA
eukprot:TRINITY_DN3631_c0_g2_i10.p1 TRINITY_DN3631_c0_g2~~TRINITY_DN3631_c0_g2_i10.p1  ORF type:complete len:320 (-),score=28.32 TRINITY_DN3631_c0_g2_i10:1639-2598(-)